MKERRKEEERNFWDGHSFQNNCEWAQESPRSLIDLTHESLSDLSRGIDGFKEYNKLRELVKTGKLSSLKRFMKGEVFDPKNFPLGTFVRLSRDYQINDKFLIWDGEITSYDLYGIVQEQNIRGYNHDILICFKAQQIQKARFRHEPNRLFFGETRVGEVYHYRMTNPNSFLDHIFEPNTSESLERVNYLEVLKYGTGTRKRLQHTIRAQRPLPDVLNPGRVFNYALSTSKVGQIRHVNFIFSQID